MKFKFFLTFLLISVLLMVLAVAVLAEEEPPPPYAGLKNPFSWSDASVQESGKGIYQQSCLGCHGADGGSIAGSDFSAADSPQRLEERPDLHFWILSEGRLDRGMPPYKSSLSEEQRWQVLTYLWSLGRMVAPPEVIPPTEPPVAGVGSMLLLTASEQTQSGQPLTLTAVLRDSQGKPIGSATIKFFIRVDFFTSGLMEIGEAVTNDEGVTVLEYTPRQTGDIQIVARHQGGSHETAITVNLMEHSGSFYQAEAGVRLPAPGPEVFIGPESALEPGEGTAPMTAFRLPAGILSWLWLFAGAVILIWLTYFRVIYQVFRIPIVSEIEDTNTRLVPLISMAVIVLVGILLVLMLITGPYTHFHLLR